MIERKETPQCLACGRDEHTTPLVLLAHQGARTWICPQDLPVLIHNPKKLAGRLPGAEDLQPAKGHG